MTFNAWLKKQADRNDAVGDFARDAITGKKFPSSKNKWREHLAAVGACDGAKEAFETAVIEHSGGNPYKDKHLSFEEHVSIGATLARLHGELSELHVTIANAYHHKRADQRLWNMIEDLSELRSQMENIMYLENRSRGKTSKELLNVYYPINEGG